VPALKPAVFEQEYIIHYYEIDYKKRMLITSLMNYFDDVAICQSENLGIGIDFLREHDCAWMLYKWDINIYKYLMFSERVKVRTAPYSFYKFYAYRWFEVLNQKGKLLAKANSLWLLVNTAKKRPIKIPELMYERFKVDASKTLNMEDLTPPSAIHTEKLFQVRYSDIDTNKHVNNVKYAEWALETVPLDIVLNYTLNKLKVTYKKETTYGKIINAQTEIKEHEDYITCLHKIIDEVGKELCLLESTWVK